MHKDRIARAAGSKEEKPRWALALAAVSAVANVARLIRELVQH
ncbi:hypothetical protein [Streptomyces sp. 142MFCol3.1]|nr:hypothetical protein [Streptomyces sp. 142MFCol3.1]